jgi:hypothetical protein
MIINKIKKTPSMHTENALVSALTYLLKYQESRCNMAGERAVMMLEAITEIPDIAPELQELCVGTIDSIELQMKGNHQAPKEKRGAGLAAYRPCSGVGLPLYADLSLR